MPHSYSGFGLSLQSDCAIPGLCPAGPLRSIDTQLWLSAGLPPALGRRDGEPWYASTDEEGSVPALRVWRLKDGCYFHLLYADGTEFIVDRAGANVWARWPSSSTLADTATYLLGPVLGFVLRLRGVTCLHGSAVSGRDAAIALVGPQGAGKSTTAALFAQLQYSILADDITPVSRHEGSWQVRPTYPQLRLWPDVVDALYGSPDALRPLTPTWPKRGLDLTSPGNRFEHRCLPLAAIYLLRDCRSDAAPAVEPVEGRAGLLALLGNTYMSYLLESPMRRREFEDLSALAADVPVRSVTYPRDLRQVSRVCSTILADWETLGCTA